MTQFSHSLREASPYWRPDRVAAVISLWARQVSGLKTTRATRSPAAIPRSCQTAVLLGIWEMPLGGVLVLKGGNLRVQFCHEKRAKLSKLGARNVHSAGKNLN